MRHALTGPIFMTGHEAPQSPVLYIVQAHTERAELSALLPGVSIAWNASITDGDCSINSAH